MKLIEAMQKVDRSPSNTFPANWEDFQKELDLPYLYDDDKFSDTVTEHYLFKRLCTDTWVGATVYYMDDNPIAYAYRPARKSDKKIHFVSAFHRDKLVDFYMSLLKPEPVFGSIIADLDEEIEEYVRFTYGDDILYKTGIYCGDEVEIVRKRYVGPEYLENLRNAVIIHNGVEKKVLAEDIMFPIQIIR